MAAAPGPAALRVRVSAPPGDRLERKLLLHFQSPQRSGGGECNLRRGPTPGTYLVRFVCPLARERVKSHGHHEIQLDNRNVQISIEPESDTADPGESQSTPLSSGLPAALGFLQPQKSTASQHLGEKRNDSSSSTFTDQIFLHVSATLNTHLFTKQQREEVISMCPGLKPEKNPSDHGIEKVTGTYADIEKVYHRFNQLLVKNDQRTDFLHAEGTKELEDKNGVDGVNSIEVQSALYEYFSHVCQEQIEELQQRFNVEIKSQEQDSGLVSVYFLCAGSPVLAENAKQSFITAFQKALRDLKQEKVAFANSSELNEAVQKVHTKFRGLLAKKHGNTIILRGPANEIKVAKTFLEEKDMNSPVERNIRIEAGYYTHKNGIEVDATEFELAEIMLNKEIEEITVNFNTTMEKKPCLAGRKLRVIFKPKNKDSDMSSHAYESFITVFQVFSSKIIQKTLPLKLPAVQQQELNNYLDHLRSENTHVIIRRKEDKLLLTGVMDSVLVAEKYIFSWLENSTQMKTETAQIKTGTAHGAQQFHGANFTETAGVSQETDRGKADKFLSEKQSRPKAEGEEQAQESCAICMDKISEKETLSKCKHEFCKVCIDKSMQYKPACPICNTFYGCAKGNQPDGFMSVTTAPYPLPGYLNCNTLVITYTIPNGIQSKDHPNPGKPYRGTQRTAYLPNNTEGNEIQELLKKAFNQKLIFTVGQSRTSGVEDVVTWNDIHHKTQIRGGPQQFGYPDPNYLKRVREELKAKGIE
ncbi:PREDICTED: E3 ubiquitin-protein ligase DTX3L [Gavialis gangeticus]|uniref:E3 ubiquitin-protein ligase DTX3L n=1 Tax=Gavialis gangeticus TaxID=94835 RepID=UPI00092E2F6C|nr:PREDICTED: E3 ubiquitin-protein ligase DTX3L [Gavialis gangeticus]